VKSKKEDRRSTSGAKFLGFSFAPGAKIRQKEEEAAARKMAKGTGSLL
jgi:hypothetical protein